jgi:hypothetical protein
MYEGIPKVPKLELAQYKFFLSKESALTKSNKTLSAETKQKLSEGIVLDSIIFVLN